MFYGHSPDAAAIYHVSKLSAGTLLTPHFRLGEFASHDGYDMVLVHPALLVLLERLRQRFGPVVINSGFRSEAHNRAIGGSRNSAHMLGMAADVRCPGQSPAAVADFLETLKPGGLGRYATFTHVDVLGHDRRWRG